MNNDLLFDFHTRCNIIVTSLILPHLVAKMWKAVLLSFQVQSFSTHFILHPKSLLLTSLLHLECFYLQSPTPHPTTTHPLRLLLNCTTKTRRLLQKHPLDTDDNSIVWISGTLPECQIRKWQNEMERSFSNVSNLNGGVGSTVWWIWLPLLFNSTAFVRCVGVGLFFSCMWVWASSMQDRPSHKVSCSGWVAQSIWLQINRLDIKSPCVQRILLWMKAPAKWIFFFF